MTLTQEQWNAAWINEGAILMNPGAEADEDGRVTKRFNVRVGRDFKDRVAFFFPARLNLTAEALATTAEICYDDRCTQYDSFLTIGADGNDP